MYETLSQVVRNPRSAEVIGNFLNTVVVGFGEGMAYTILRDAVRDLKGGKEKNRNALKEIAKCFIGSAGRKVGHEILADVVEKYELGFNITSSVLKDGEKASLLEKTKRGFCNGLVSGTAEGIGIELGAMAAKYTSASVKKIVNMVR